MWHTLFAYIGIGPGQEFIPYFLTLLAFMGAALGAVLQWPLTLVYRLVRRLRGGAAQVSEPESTPEAGAVAQPEGNREQN